MREASRSRRSKSVCGARSAASRRSTTILTGRRTGSATSSRTTRGTGLGLFIVKGLIEAMNGKISLHSDEDCGFCVEITMNLANTEL